MKRVVKGAGRFSASPINTVPNPAVCLQGSACPTVKVSGTLNQHPGGLLAMLP